MNIKDLLGNKYKEGMTLEEIETALADVEMPTDSSAEVERLKTALSKSNSEAADYKKQLREKLSADEVKDLFVRVRFLVNQHVIACHCFFERYLACRNGLQL